MDVKSGNVKKNGQSDETQCSSQEMLDCVRHRMVHVAQNDPQLLHRVQAHQQYHKEPDKLDGERATQHATCERQPQPPGDAERTVAQVPELDHGVSSAGNEEQQNGIQQNVTIQCQESDVCQNKLGLLLFFLAKNLPNRMSDPAMAAALTDFVNSQTVK